MRNLRFVTADKALVLCLAAVAWCLMVGPVFAQNGIVEISRVDGIYHGDTLSAHNANVTFYLQYTNTIGRPVNVSNGWRVHSPDGAVWLQSRLDTLPPFVAGTWYFGTFFSQDYGFYPSSAAGDGSSTPDTLGMFGVIDPNVASHWPPYVDGTFLAITLNMPTDPTVNDGKRICIDSASWSPEGTWKWTEVGDPINYTPEWRYRDRTHTPGIGYCFTIAYLPNCKMTPLPPPPASITGIACGSMGYSFGESSPGGESMYYELLAGPGSMNEFTGYWTWIDIPPEASGTHQIRYRVSGIGCVGAEAEYTVDVNILPGNLNITSGFGTSSHLTGDLVQTQVTVDPSGCVADYWTLHQSLGSEASFSISNEGLLQFTTFDFGVYVIDIMAHAGEVVDTASHTYVVHGGPGCCVGARGNVNGMGIVDLSDLSLLIGYLTAPYVVLPCWDAANVNTQGIIDLGDLSSLIAYMVSPSGSVSLPPCP